MWEYVGDFGAHSLPHFLLLSPFAWLKCILIRSWNIKNDSFEWRQMSYPSVCLYQIQLQNTESNRTADFWGTKVQRTERRRQRVWAKPKIRTRTKSLGHRPNKKINGQGWTGKASGAKTPWRQQNFYCSSLECREGGFRFFFYLSDFLSKCRCIPTARINKMQNANSQAKSNRRVWLEVPGQPKG